MTTTYASDEDHKENDVLRIKNAHRVPFPELGMDIIDREYRLSTCHLPNPIACVIARVVETSTIVPPTPLLQNFDHG